MGVSVLYLFSHFGINHSIESSAPSTDQKPALDVPSAGRGVINRIPVSVVQPIESDPPDLD